MSGRRQRRERHGRRGRRLLSTALTAGVGVLSVLAVLPLIAILGYVLYRGGTALNLDFFVEGPVPVGQPGGGVAPAIVGSFLMVGAAAAVGLPVGIGAGIFLAEYGSGRLGWLVRFVADVLNGTPSIIAGIFVWAWVVRRAGHFSAYAGILALAMLLVPVIARTTEEMLRLVPHSLREAALALGYPRWRASLGIVLRTASVGIATGALVGVARIAGETAPLLFTALGNLNFTADLREPMQALPLQIFVYATAPFEEWHRLAWAAALVLVVLVLAAALAARRLARHRYGGA